MHPPAPKGQSIPLFQFAGPSMDPSFWSDPEAAGRTLLLQGELMVEMGKVLIRQGKALLESHPTEERKVKPIPPKIGPRLQLYLNTLPPEKRDKKVKVLVMIEGEWSPDMEARLKALGFEAEGTVGHTISGTVPASRIPALAAIPEVKQVELPAPFRLKPPAVQAQPAKP